MKSILLDGRGLVAIIVVGALTIAAAWLGNRLFGAEVAVMVAAPLGTIAAVWLLHTTEVL